MNACFFGSYTPDYPRNKILIDGLEKNGVSVFQCNCLAESAFVRYPQLFKKFWSIRNQINVIYVGFFGHLDMPLAWLLGRLTGKKVIFDMFYSMYDTYVFDRRSTKPGSFRAFTYYWIDKIAGTLADCIIIDTNTHGKYFQKLLGLNPQKFQRVFVGGDDTVFTPRKKKSSKKIIIEFHGMFTRLHGAEYYVKAAKLLENEKNLKFLLIGSTRNYPLPLELYRKLRPKNMVYVPELPVNKLAKILSRCDISVGHIGVTIKAKSVITNKIFHGLASRVAVIAGDCSASSELLVNGKTAIFTKMGSVSDLVKNIKLLVFNNSLRKEIAENGFQLSQLQLTNEKLGKKLFHICNELLRN